GRAPRSTLFPYTTLFRSLNYGQVEKWEAIALQQHFNTIEEAIEEFKKGKMIVVVDDEDRENEGDLVMAAEMATPEEVNFMARFRSEEHTSELQSRENLVC